jgi:hypothetical protein
MVEAGAAERPQPERTRETGKRMAAKIRAEEAKVMGL